MLKFITISFILMIIGCAIMDKIDDVLRGESEHEATKDNPIDVDTLEIMKCYGLINTEQSKL